MFPKVNQKFSRGHKMRQHKWTDRWVISTGHCLRLELVQVRLYSWLNTQTNYRRRNISSASRMVSFPFLSSQKILGLELPGLFPKNTIALCVFARLPDPVASGEHTVRELEQVKNYQYSTMDRWCHCKCQLWCGLKARFPPKISAFAHKKDQTGFLKN